MAITNKELQLAEEFLQHTDCNIFLTGKAGTGKTTFLRDLKKNSPKRMVVTAPTGVAAINAAGVTLHSFFQMPFGPFVPGSEAFSQSKKRRFNKEKINIIKSLDLLVIDEISMVRADLLDGINAVLQRYRYNSEPFGGVQLLMIGDLNQLPPVVKDNEWQILREHYSSAYFFGSNTLQQTEMFTVELKHIYRQSDRNFIDILNSVRDNSLNKEKLAELNDRFIPDFAPEEKEGFITLCTHNRNADTINTSNLQRIKNKPHVFQAEIDGDFPEHTFPTTANLELKVGAQVMFMRNDSSLDKLYFNGKIGKITQIDDNEIWVKCPGEHNQIIVEAAEWENIEYKLDEESSEIQENKIGAFTQIPLRLAWAITIHKSQGLTFDKAIIDAQAAFAHGQVYVALSRCRTLEGLVLRAPIPPNAIKTDREVVQFTKNGQQSLPSLEKLNLAKIYYQQKLLFECFDFKKSQYLFNRLLTDLSNNQTVLQLSGIKDIHQIKQAASDQIFAVSENFKRQLQGLFTDTLQPIEDTTILERISKASSYFNEKIESVISPCIKNLVFDTDNKELKKRINKNLKLLKEETAVKMAAVSSCKHGFSPPQYLREISKAGVVTSKSKVSQPKVSYVESDIEHPELFQILRDWRLEKATSENIAPFQVMHQKALVQLTIQMPNTPKNLLKVKGIGKQLSGRYGTELIDIILAYREKKEITTVALPAETRQNSSVTKEEPENQLSTKEITLHLFKDGLSMGEIAKKRSLAPSTIEGHMAFFISKKQVQITDLLSQEKIDIINQTFEKMKTAPFNEIKQALGGKYSYGEIKLVQAHRTK